MPDPTTPAPQDPASLQSLVSALQNLAQAINGLTTMLKMALAGVYDQAGTN